MSKSPHEQSRHPHYTHADDARLQELFDSLPECPTEAQAEEILQACGTSGKEVVNEFIDRLLRENLELKQKLSAPAAQPPTADAEGVALEVVRSLYNANCFECSDVFCTHWQSSAASIIYDALSATEQRGRDERNEFLQQVLRAAAEEEVNLHVSSGLLKAISIIRSNQ